MTAEAMGGILDAHGGMSYWQSLSTVDLNVSIRGFLFTAKRIPVLRNAAISVNVRKPEVALEDFPEPGQIAVLDGANRVEIRDLAGNVLSSRTDPRAKFGQWRRSLYWDALDFTYFCGYAMWNYLTLPFLLTHPGVRVDTIGEPSPDGETRLRARFPSELPTHCPVQDFWFDRDGLLRRHDYTAEVIGSWARAAHLCEKYRQFGGLSIPTRRRVYPRGPLGRPLAFPTLVAIDIHEAWPR
ncbi:hypothetical protein [Mycolicibacterium sp.]|uniref:hypothetical protein n=1 Tax=Mycolicibacterium sp. TaxID=2320850 RepID=UPI0025EF9892|nr:hypothetical protein [Mycolicibacterium sp.]